jgi:hypothetical protein
MGAFLLTTGLYVRGIHQMANINSTNQVSVGTNATLIIAATKPNTSRQSVTIYNTSGATVFVGASTVTTGTGHGIAAGGSLTLNVSGAVYGIVASSTSTVSFIEIV